MGPSKIQVGLKQMVGVNKEELIITYIFDAPRELLWKAWTDPEILIHWWWPDGFTTTISKMDFRVGGQHFSCVRSPEGQESCSKSIYQEIVEPERLVMTNSFTDKEGNTVQASDYGLSQDFPMEMQITVIFEEHNGKTKLILKNSDVESMSEKTKSDTQQGWNESFEKLVRYLQKL